MAWRNEFSPEYLGGGGGNGGGDTEGSYMNKRIVRTNCKTEEVEPGRFVRKCEKTEQLLRQCAGRPAEIVESKTEHIEEDISNEVEQGFPSFESKDSDPFTFPGLRSDLESIQGEFLGGFSNFMEATERMTKELLSSFGMPSMQRSWPPLEHERRPAPHWQHDNRSSKEMKDPYAGLDVEIREV